MSVKVSAEQGQQEVVKGIKQYTGIAPFKVIAINPNQVELIAIGINAQKEPEYLNEDKVRIDIWLQSVEEIGGRHLFRKFSTFLEPNARMNNAKTKSEWINAFGTTCWTKDGDDPDVAPSLNWFKQNGARKAYVGEGQLISFLRTWVNASAEDEVSLDTWDNILRGNVAELRDLVRIYKDNVIRAMMTVRSDDKGNFYDDVYAYYFSRWNITSVTGWAKHFKTNTVKPNVHYSYDIQEFKPKPVQADPEPTAEESAWT